MTTSERIKAVINHVAFDGGISDFQTVLELNAILADLDAEPPKPTGEPVRDCAKCYRKGTCNIVFPETVTCELFLPAMSSLLAPNDISKGVWFKSEGSDEWCKGRFVGQVSAVMADGMMFVPVEHNRRLAHNHEDVARWLDDWSRAYKNGLRSTSELNLIIKEANRQCKGGKE